MKNKIKFSKFEKSLLCDASKRNKTIVLPEAEHDDRVLQAGLYLANHNICNVVFLANDENVLSEYQNKKNIMVLNTSKYEKRQELVSVLYDKRKDKGVTEEQANMMLNNNAYFATMLLECGIVDGMVCGAIMSTADTLRPALQIVKGKKKGGLISSFMIMASNDKTLGENGVLYLADIALNQDPTAEQLATIAEDTVDSARSLGVVNPKVALLSYSTLGSAEGEIPTKMQRTKELIKSSDFVYDGDYQFDSATRPEVAKIKAKQGLIQGDANVLIFPNLESGNITYKAMCRAGKIQAIGPITQGLRLPVNDLSRGANVQEIIVTVAVTILQCK